MPLTIEISDVSLVGGLAIFGLVLMIVGRCAMYLELDHGGDVLVMGAIMIVIAHVLGIVSGVLIS